MNTLKWAEPQAFWLILVLVVLAAVYFIFEKKFIAKINHFFGVKVSAYLSQSVSYNKRRIQLGLQLIGLFFVIVALARPQAGERLQDIKSEGIELMILADVSESMLAEDVKPSRLQQLKIELSKMLDLLPGNKIGIIAFAGSSALLSPLTSDPNALRMYIDSLDTTSVSSQGTNFENALTYGLDAFQKGGISQDGNARTTRAILIASDGEDQEQGAIEAAKKAADAGVKIYTVAYGTEKGSAIPERDRAGNMIGYKKDKDGQTVLTQVKGTFLKQLADAGQGSFYFASFGGQYINDFANDLNKLEKSQFQSSTITQYDEKFVTPLFIGILFLLLSFFVNDRQSTSKAVKGKYEF